MKEEQLLRSWSCWEDIGKIGVLWNMELLIVGYLKKKKKERKKILRNICSHGTNFFTENLYTNNVFTLSLKFFCPNGWCSRFVTWNTCNSLQLFVKLTYSLMEIHNLVANFTFLV